MYDEVWEAIFSRGGWGRYPAEELIRFVAREAAGHADRSGLRALELGCGPGANLWFLAREGLAFDAIDGSASAVAQARTRLDAELPGWRGEIVQGDFLQLPPHFRGYDFAIDSQALSSNGFSESRGVIAEVFERLRPGGAFWSRCFAPGTWGVESGQPVAEDCWRAVEGPLAGRGMVRITQPDAIDRLYGGRWASITVGEITRHEGDPRQTIREWIITARKSR